jgi:hypothetical protein
MSRTLRCVQTSRRFVLAGGQPQDRESLGLTIPPSVLARADQIVESEFRPPERRALGFHNAWDTTSPYGRR